jgi:hypothetical protein
MSIRIPEAANSRRSGVRASPGEVLLARDDAGHLIHRARPQQGLDLGAGLVHGVTGREAGQHLQAVAARASVPPQRSPDLAQAPVRVASVVVNRHDVAAEA